MPDGAKAEERGMPNGAKAQKPRGALWRLSALAQSGFCAVGLLRRMAFAISGFCALAVGAVRAGVVSPLRHYFLSQM
jgi:hypothetical protein